MRNTFITAPSTRDTFMEIEEDGSEDGRLVADRMSRRDADRVVRALNVLGELEEDGRMSDHLRSLIEGMSVSVDVSTGDHDAGHRYFGTVTEVMDDPQDKHGVTLLVQDAKPNFSTPTQPSPLTDSLSFVIEQRGQHLILDWSKRGGQGCRPAEETEIEMWNLLATGEGKQD